MDYFMNEDKSDITLIIDGHKIPANRLILGLKSPVFDRMFFGNFKQSNQKEIQIKDVSIDSFKVMLKWIYCQELDLNEENDYLMAIDVFKLSHRFELKKLMTTIEHKLIQIISIENIEVFTKFATFYDLKQLIKSCEHFIENNPKLLIEKDIDLCFDNKLLKLMANEHKKSLIQNKDLIEMKEELSSENAKLRNDYQLLFEDYKKVKDFFWPLLRGQNLFYVNGKLYEKCKGFYDCKHERIYFKY